MEKPYYAYMSDDLDLELIEREIAKQGRTKAWVAEQIGLEPNTFYAVLAGRRNLGRSAAILLSQVLEIDLDTMRKSAS